jgi:ribosomal protein L35
MNITAKSKKTFLKRLKVTKRGKVLSRKPGQNHFQAKQKRSKQLTGKRLQNFDINKKTLGKFLS